MRISKLPFIATILFFIVSAFNLHAEEAIKAADFCEPSIGELQRAAIRYAEVYPEKITNWRKQVAVKALMPKIAVGYDNNIYQTIGTSTKNSQVYFWEGPDDGSRGWDVTATWDLSDLIYNESQTSIDSRSKLMVQLRNDILDQLNAAYFQRKKLKRELERISDNTSQAYLEREIKIEELAATIDGLTGGYLTQRLSE